MDKRQAIESFKENYLEPKSTEKMDQLREYYNANKDELVTGFVESFRQICIKIKEMQQSGMKDKIGYITFSLMRTNITNRKYVYVIDAYNDEWFYDQVECQGEYDVSWAFKFLDEFEEELEDKRKLYAGKITKADMDMLRMDELGIYDDSIVDLARYAMPKATKLKEYEEILKHEVIEIRVGEYKGINEVVYKEDIRVKDPKEIKKWLEKKLENDYIYEILRNLDISNGDYEGLDIRYGDLSGSNLSNSSLKEGVFIGTKFMATVLENADLSGAMFDHADLSNANLKNSMLNKAEGGDINFENSDMRNIKANGAQISFANMNNVDLRNADISNSKIKHSTFKGTLLEGVDFSNSDLSYSDLRGAVLKDTNLQNAKLKKAIFFKSDIDILNLDEEQKKAIIVDEG